MSNVDENILLLTRKILIIIISISERELAWLSNVVTCFGSVKKIG